MSTQNDSGPADHLPAFPDPSLADPNYRPQPGDYGMSLRDWFAGQAVNGLLAHPDCGMVGPDHGMRTARAAVEAYAIADAMLAERDKP